MLTHSQGLFYFLCCPASKELGVHKKLEGDTGDQTDQRDIPYHMALVIKAGVKKKEERDVQSDDICLSKKLRHDVPCFPGRG